jgi:alkanesulfonate monooxygenase
MTKQIRLNAFAMNCVAHQSPGLWTHPRDRTIDYNRLLPWIDLARTLERGRFDGLFLADVLGVCVSGAARTRRSATPRRRRRTSR